MKTITLPKVNWRVSQGLPGLKAFPGRNDPAYGVWMIEHLIPQRKRACAVIADPFAGGGQLWVKAPPGVIVIGCELRAERADLARRSGLAVTQGDALTWAPHHDSHLAKIDLVAFSMPYKKCDHDSGNKSNLVEEKGLQSMQDIGPRPDPLRVFTQIATYCGDALVALINKNYIEGQVEVDDTGELIQAAVMAGFQLVEVYRVFIGTGFTESAKKARKEFQAKTGQQYRAVEHEHIIVLKKG